LQLLAPDYLWLGHPVHSFAMGATFMENRADTNSDTDRRQERRAKTDVFVNRFLNGHPYLCRMIDISRSGARLVAINEPKISPPPLFMGLQFQLPGRPEVVTASGEAVTTDAGRTVGIRFTRMATTAASAIEAFVHRAS
jgi:hypothetical protein